MRQYSWADVFVFTSLRDTCGTVVLEALSHGLPVICLDHQGVGSVVTDRCGIKVQVTAPPSVVNGLRDAVMRAASDDLLLEALSRGAIQASQAYLWLRHGERLANLYEHAIKAHGHTIHDHGG
jgi:glycosyltransferase involved in cell wall biosynthesis